MNQATMPAAKPEVCCGTYSYCRQSKGNQPVNGLEAAEALPRIAANGPHSLCRLLHVVCVWTH